MAMATSRCSRMTRAMRFMVLLLAFIFGMCHGELLVATTHPAPAATGSLQQGLDVAPRLAASTPYYISYGALDANRAPCPAGTGRSYYTQSCQGSGDVQPYTRSCTAMARCARG